MANLKVSADGVFCEPIISNGMLALNDKCNCLALGNIKCESKHFGGRWRWMTRGLLTADNSRVLSSYPCREFLVLQWSFGYFQLPGTKLETSWYKN